ncbi:MAG: enoyl-CoA hydratase-related protein [Planctomycetota bacterium]
MDTKQQWEECWKASMVVLYQKGKIGKIVLNRPESHNAFNPQLIQELKQAFQQFEENPHIRVVLLTGAGKSFCSGADLNWMKQMNQYSMEENLQDAMKMAQLFHQIQIFPKPLIAQVNGVAMGGGLGLIAVCDGVVAQEKATFAFSEVRLGLIPAVISPYLLKKIGFSHSRQLMMSGENFSTTTAKEIGLIHEICLQHEYR